MAGRPLAITQRQVTALCKGAKVAGYVPMIQIGKALVKLVPEDRAIPYSAKEPVDDDGDFVP